nr:transporter substrate-binding domain-containing protein [Calditerricola satsumensis]
MKKGNKELLDKINQGLKAIKANGQYDEIYQKYFGTKK